MNLRKSLIILELAIGSLGLNAQAVGNPVRADSTGLSPDRDQPAATVNKQSPTAERLDAGGVGVGVIPEDTLATEETPPSIEGGDGGGPEPEPEPEPANPGPQANNGNPVTFNVAAADLNSDGVTKPHEMGLAMAAYTLQNTTLQLDGNGQPTSQSMQAYTAAYEKFQKAETLYYEAEGDEKTAQNAEQRKAKRKDTLAKVGGGLLFLTDILVESGIVKGHTALAKANEVVNTGLNKLANNGTQGPGISLKLNFGGGEGTTNVALGNVTLPAKAGQIHQR